MAQGQKIILCNPMRKQNRKAGNADRGTPGNGRGRKAARSKRDLSSTKQTLKPTAPNCTVGPRKVEGKIWLPSRWTALGKKKLLLILTTMQKWFYFCQPTKIAFHDLRIGKVSPKALKSLWGLGVKLCPANLLPMLYIDKSMEQFERDLHIRSVLAGSEDLMPLANPKIYISSKWKPFNWEILLALKRRLRTFCKALEPKLWFHPIRHNLLPHQRQTIRFIKKNPNLMVVQTKKGLGPGSIDSPEYFWFAIKDHIGNAQTYQHLSPAAAAYRANLVRKLLEKWIKTYLDVLSNKERKFLRTNLSSNKEPWVSCISFSRCIRFRWRHASSCHTTVISCILLVSSSQNGFNPSFECRNHIFRINSR